ncbi:hypothetical protein [Paraburkholderia piptadeniae]|uniref:hypothetical protein n=1 Tax=Paraburkholderia piptadeniae TaxID=1701573 RepID=UPI001180C178|nr:hypothetical protein [Paraburkholderia piptadeniae]
MTLVVDHHDIDVLHARLNLEREKERKCLREQTRILHSTMNQIFEKAALFLRDAEGRSDIGIVEEIKRVSNAALKEYYRVAVTEIS